MMLAGGARAPGRGARHREIERMLDERTEANARFFAAEAERLARLCHTMAERFARSGRLVAVGSTPAGRSDARHVAVEFVHPVIVGKRALPAIGLTGGGGTPAEEVDLLAEAGDIVIAFDADRDGGQAARAIELARRRGCLTIAFTAAGAEHEFAPPAAAVEVRQELVETLYHVLWELVHVFFDQRGLLAERDSRPVHDAGAARFLYPFLGEQETQLEPVVDDVRRSVLMKSQEIGALRAQTLLENSDALAAAAATLAASFERGGKLLALGNGGSATDAMDVVADLRFPPAARRSRPALDLSEDSAILTAIANDIGTEAIFSRQVIAYGRPGDTLLALSTSGDSANVIAALAEARRRGLETIAMVGYDGGRVAAQSLADHVIVTRSEHIPRIQEAQASAYHSLLELIELVAI
ncbi:MAG TPA: SIS domain-containing protein [Solirubrobacteraceae bacterium]|jgi:D-sedoheptulose 7-phosphate isomerase|nr:SIS domain-containing protein [Solirubrobacteraceae bacterium]